MSRYLILLVPFLACVGSARGDDAAMPPLESRVGRTITIVEAQKPTDKATITHAWRLADGTPVMQAKSLSTGLQMTIVENAKATSAADRIKVHHWTKDGVAPAGCPTMPVAKPMPAAKPTMTAPTTVVTKPTMTAPSTVVTKPTVAAPPAMPKPDKVATMEGGLLPVMPKKETPKTVTTVAATQPATPATTAKVDTKPMTPAVKTEPKPLQTVATTPAPKASAQSVITPVQATVQTRTVTPPPAAPVVGQKPHLIGGCEVITVTENGKPRQYKVVGMARDRDGMMVQRCEALDNGQIITLNCGGCVTSNCAPVCNTPCPQVVVTNPCPPVVVTKPCPPPVVVQQPKPAPPVTVAPPKVEQVKPPVAVAPPAPVACPPVKCEPCPKACETKCDTVCDRCTNCGGKGCDECCGHRHEKHHKEHKMHGTTMINVPVPGVMLNATGGFPSGPPPQPLIPSFCTANSSSVLAALNGPVLYPMKCMYQPFTPGMNAQILTGISMCCSDPVEGEAVKNTLMLINVLQSSKEWENRQWAAERLQTANLPTIKPYVEDCLMAAAQYDRAPHVKASAIRTLAVLRPERVDLMMGLITQSLGDENPMVQQAAGRAIEHLVKGNVQQTGSR